MTEEGIHLLSDNPIEATDPSRDGLDFHIYADVLARAALGTPGPFTIGVFGDWGTGKTSLMQMVKGKLDGMHTDPKVVTVWFNAWRFEQEQHPIVPLIATIIRSIEDKAAVLKKLGNKGRPLITALRAVAYGMSGSAKIGVPGVVEVEAAFVAKDMVERAEKLTHDPLLDRSIYYEVFERLAEINVADKLKLVILIDDLDRCFPDMAIKLLESIKLVLAQPGFIFILGVSRPVIEGYLRHRYEKEYGLVGFEGRSYLDKMVQLPFPIPPHRDRMRAFSERLLKTLELADADELKQILPIVGVACGSNPRATVRFVNNLLIDKAINQSMAAAGGVAPVPIGFFAVTRSLEQRWPEMYSRLAASDPLCSRLGRLGHETLEEQARIEASLPGTDTCAPEDLEKVLKRVAADSDEDDQGTREAVDVLAGQLDLQELLFSRQGRDWLANADLRKAAIQFLQTKRRETVEEDTRVLLLYDRDDMSSAEVIFRLLKDQNLDAFGMPATMGEFAHPDVPNVIWLLGSDWKRHEALGQTIEKMPGQKSRRRYFVVLPQAKESTLPSRVPNLLTLVLEDEEITQESLQQLITALVGWR